MPGSGVWTLFFHQGRTTMGFDQETALMKGVSAFRMDLEKDIDLR